MNDVRVDPARHNRQAWNREAAEGGPWSTPVDAVMVAQARAGAPSLTLTPSRVVPTDWLGPLAGRRLLGLASAGGQQMPLLAAAGAMTTSFDLSDVQLALDARVAAREGLRLDCVQGDMTRPLPFADGAFELIFHPVSNLFVPDPAHVWRECARLLAPGGVLLAGVMNPAWFLFDHDEAERTGRIVARYRLPFTEPDDLDAEGRTLWAREGRQVVYGHDLDVQLGALLRAGFVLADFFEDPWDADENPLRGWLPAAFALHAVRR